jgi:hypothetical protein
MTDAASDQPTHTAAPPSAVPDPPDPPGWAERSVAEDDGITHELVSSLSPRVSCWSTRGRTTRPTEVSMAIIDRRTRSGWTRGAPTVQIEGGSYSLPQARRLSLAIDELLRTLEIRPADPSATID